MKLCRSIINELIIIIYHIPLIHIYLCTMFSYRIYWTTCQTRMFYRLLPVLACYFRWLVYFHSLFSSSGYNSCILYLGLFGRGKIWIVKAVFACIWHLTRNLKILIIVTLFWHDWTSHLNKLLWEGLCVRGDKCVSDASHLWTFQVLALLATKFF